MHFNRAFDLAQLVTSGLYAKANEKVILGLLWTSKEVFSRPEMLLRLENNESVDHVLLKCIRLPNSIEPNRVISFD